jgi:hypothetical protein
MNSNLKLLNKWSIDMLFEKKMVKKINNLSTIELNILNPIKFLKF